MDDLVVDGKIVVKLIFKKWDGEARTGLFCLRKGQEDSGCECGNERSCSTKCQAFLDHMRIFSFS